MLAGIKGIIIEKNEGSLILEAGFFRFHILSPQPVIESCDTGKEKNLFTHLHVREDDLSLFGFENKDQLSLFRSLISVSGIGPKTALEILSAGDESVRHAIVSEDISFLQSIKGIGKKTAQRAILELREKIDPIGIENGKPETHKSNAIAHEEAISALEGLGWKKVEISYKLKNVPNDLEKAEEIVKWFLTNSA